MIKPNKKFMDLAIKKAVQIRKKGELAIGAVVVKGDKILSAVGNQTKSLHNPVAHAETLAIVAACKKMKNRHIPGSVLYTTHEPCAMCSALLVWAKMKGVVYGARYKDMKDYAKKNANEEYQWRTIEISCRDVFKKSPQKIEVVSDFMRDECKKLFHNKI